MKRPFLLFSALLFALMAGAQQVSYRVTEDNPGLVPRLQVYLTPFQAEAGQMSRHTLGWGFGGRWDINNRISVFLQQRKAYKGGGDFTYRSVAGPGSIPAHNSQFDSFKPFSYTEMYGRINLISKRKTKPNQKVNLNSSRHGSTTVNTYIEIPVEVQRYFGLRGGIIRYVQTFEMGDEDTPLTASDGTTFGTYGAYDAEGNELLYEYNTLYWGVNQRVYAIAAGLSWSTLSHTVINANGYGTRKACGTHDVALDFLFAPAIGIDDIHYGEHTWELKGDGEGMIQTRNWGMQFSYHMMTSNRGVNWGYSISCGWRPGMKGSGGFLEVGWKLPVIGFKVPALPGGMDA